MSTVQHATLRRAVEEDINADVILIQEPWFWPLPDGTRGTTALEGWSEILPVPVFNIPKEKRPRVVAYAKRGSTVEVTLRSDLITDLDIMILDIKRRGPGNPTTRVYNIYNQIRLGGEDWSISDLMEHDIDLQVPTILTGDFNLHHPMWESKTTNPGALATETVGWLMENGLDLLNIPDVPTFFKYDPPALSTIDLTFANQAAIESHMITGHQILHEIDEGSDHYPTSFQLGKPTDSIPELSPAPFNWKHADPEMFAKSLIQYLHADEGIHNTIFGPLHPIQTEMALPSTEQVDLALTTFNLAMLHAANEAVPRHRPSARAKPWWNPECTSARDLMRSLRAAARMNFIENGVVPEEMAAQVTNSKNRYLRRIKKEKREFYNRKVEEADRTTFWDFRRWTKGRRAHLSPALVRPDGSAATSHEDKCAILRTTLFPTLPQLEDAPPINLEPHPTDLEYEKVTRREVRDEIYKMSQSNAPGFSGMTGRAYRWAWTSAEEEMFSIIQAAAAIGYQPAAWKTSIAVALQKPKRDYSIPRSYRLIQLLEVFGKILERVQACWLAYLASRYEMIPSTHFGGIPGRSAEDALLANVHDIEAAWNHDRRVSTLTLDITGFFDFVPHSYVIDTLRNLHIPLPMVKWVHSFMQDRATAICLDGKREELQATSTGIPQGSCVSPILAAFFTSSMRKELVEGIERRIQEDEHLREEIRQARAVLPSLFLYVDDGKFNVASTSFEVNNRLLAEAYKLIDMWLEKRGMATDPVKKELMHHSRKRRDKVGEGPPIALPSRTPGEIITIEPSTTLKWLGVWFDPKLKFHHHIKTVTERATRAADALGLLGNSIRGIDQLHMRQMYLGAILPMATYASPVWWNGSKATEKTLTTLQNKALRRITGAFRTTPQYAMEVEASVPPVRLHLDYLSQRAAIRIHQLDDQHPVVCRLRTDQRVNHQPPRDPPPLPAYPPPRHFRLAERHQRALERARSIFSTQLTKLFENINLDTEHLETFREAPWRRSEYDDDIRKRIRIRVPPNTPGDSLKKDWANEHMEYVTPLREDRRHILVYSDGSLSIIKGVRRTGYGVVAYRGGEKIMERKGALGEKVEVYDAEMRGIAIAAESIYDYLADIAEDAEEVTDIHFYADNTGAIQRCFSGSVGKAQQCSTDFRGAALEMLDQWPNIKIDIDWAPGHMDIPGNEEADKAAKNGSSMVPRRPSYQSLSFVGSLEHREHARQWKYAWAASQTRNNQYRDANRIPPSLQPTPQLTEHNRKMFSRIVQCRTGHAHIGAYYRKFIVDESPACVCGHPHQTRDHLLYECDQYAESRELLGEEEDSRPKELLGTVDGIRRLAKWLRATEAYEKNNTIGQDNIQQDHGTNGPN